MKTILLILTMTSFISFSQDFSRSSLEMSYGENIYLDQLGTSASSTLVNVGYRFMITKRFGIQAIGQLDVIRSKTNDQKLGYRAYSESLRGELFYRLFNIGPIAFTAHGGYGGIYVWIDSDYKERMQMITTGGGLLYRLGLKRSEWGALKASYTQIQNRGQEKTLNGLFKSTSKSKFHNITLGFLIYLDNRHGRKVADWNN